MAGAAHVRHVAGHSSHVPAAALAQVALGQKAVHRSPERYGLFAVRTQDVQLLTLALALALALALTLTLTTGAGAKQVAHVSWHGRQKLVPLAAVPAGQTAKHLQ